MATFTERLQNHPTIEEHRAIVDEARDVTKQFTDDFPSDPLVLKIQIANAAYHNATDSGSCDVDQTFRHYSRVLGELADVLTAGR